MIEIGSIPPFVIFFGGAFLLVILRGPWRSVIALMIPVFGGANLLAMEQGILWQEPFLGYNLTIVKVDKLSILFGYLFHIAAFFGIIYALHVRDTVQQVSSIVYAGSALGAVFAGDMIVLFIFWEMLAISSVFLIWAQGTERAYQAGMRYLILQIGSGVILLSGILINIHQTGSIAITTMPLENLASWLILLALGIKCAFPFLHTWLTDAYPEATPTGTVFLSAFTTKVAVYALARTFPGAEVLIYIGATMAMFPIFFAVIENDLRRVLAYSLINQVGFMVVGIGIGTELAINGAVSHAFNDVIFKGLLFMTMGAVLHRTGKINGSELGGLYKSMPWTTGFCIVGAASISAFPLFSGFVSKSMVMVAALEEGHSIVWLMLLFASAGVFHHAGIKIPFFAFFAHDSGIRTKEAPWNMLIAMGFASALCIFNGSYPAVLYSLLPYQVDYVPYDGTHVLAQMQLLFFSALAFVWLQRTGLYPPELMSVNLDSDWFYRHLLKRLIQRIGSKLGQVNHRFNNQLINIKRLVTSYLQHYFSPTSLFGGTVKTGVAVAWISVLLLMVLIAAFSST